MADGEVVRRPGGRTFATRAAVYAAVRNLTSEGSGFGIAEVAARSGVHPTTVYRRWRNVDNLVLEVAADDVAHQSPLPVTGDLRADLARWGRALVADLARPGGQQFLQAIIKAGNQPDVGAAQLEQLLAPRLDQIAALIDAADAQVLTSRDVVDMLVAPMYLTALFGIAGTAAADIAGVDRLVDNVIAVRDHRQTSANHPRLT